LHCFASPGACNYPDPNFGWNGPSAWVDGGGGVGPNNGTASIPCSSLTPSGSITTSRDGQHIRNLDVTGSIHVNNSGVEIENVCVTTDGGGVAGSGAAMVAVANGATGLTIKDTTLQSVNDTTGATDLGVQNYSGGVVTLKHDYVHGCGVCLASGAWSVTDSYVKTDAELAPGPTGPEHTEDVYFDYDVPAPGAVFKHDTLLNPHAETAVIFGDDSRGGACSGSLTLTDSLLAGGAYALYTCGGGGPGKATSVGTSTIKVQDNHWARCTTGPIHPDATTGGTFCHGIRSFRPGVEADSHGYYAEIGYYGTVADPFCGANSSQIWRGNVFDDDGEPVAC
jgi:hypothetical protein